MDFGSHAALIRWLAEASGSHDWRDALVLIGAPDALASRHALELAELDLNELYDDGGLLPVAGGEHGPRHPALAARAWSAEARMLLVPLLARVLAGEQNVTMPWAQAPLPDAVMWGLTGILAALGEARPVSFLTYAARGIPGPPGGLFVSFRPDAGEGPSDPGNVALAADLAKWCATDAPGLRAALAEAGIGAVADPADKTNLIRDVLFKRFRGVRGAQGLSPAPPAPGASAPGARVMPASPPDAPASAAAGPPPAPAPAASPPAPAPSAYGQARQSPPPATWSPPPAPASGETVICPICLAEIGNWDALGHWRWDAVAQEYAELRVPPGLNEVQLARHVRGAYVRCPASDAPGQRAQAHFLPVSYGRFGRPVLLGFVGLTTSGKSHLLAAMVGAIEAGQLEKYGITSRPIDYASHQRFLDQWVNPLLSHGKVLPGTQEGIVEFADAFLMSSGGGPPRPVAFFDVAGGDLTRADESKEFLWIADGLFFVIDPEHLGTRRIADEAFSNVLDVVRGKIRPGAVSASIILNKADKVRFEEPVTRWLRSGDGVGVDAAEFLRETADVYAYLHARGAGALTSPYQVCDKATFHVASPTGGASDGEAGSRGYPRGVTPRRVLRPLLAMLAMTGVLAGPEAEKVGV